MPARCSKRLEAVLGVFDLLPWLPLFMLLILCLTCFRLFEYRQYIYAIQTCNNDIQYTFNAKRMSSKERQRMRPLNYVIKTLDPSTRPLSIPECPNHLLHLVCPVLLLAQGFCAIACRQSRHQPFVFWNLSAAPTSAVEILRIY